MFKEVNLSFKIEITSFLNIGFHTSFKFRFIITRLFYTLKHLTSKGLLAIIKLILWNKTQIANAVGTTHFCNNLNKVRSKPKDWKASMILSRHYATENTTAKQKRRYLVLVHTTRVCNNLHQVRSKSKHCERQICSYLQYENRLLNDKINNSRDN